MEFAMNACLRIRLSIGCFVLLFWLSASGQSGTNGTIAVLGSSVAKGVGGGGSYINGSYANGYAGQLTTYLYPLEWEVTNLSIPGNSTADVLARFDEDVLPVDPDLVQIGLSMTNEGLAGSSDPEAVVETFRSGMTNIIARIRANGMYALTGLCYPSNGYSASEYQYIRNMNLLINSWDLPSYNFLGAIDDGSGHWIEGYYNDSHHPNAAGHLEMFYTIVPSLFDAIRLGKSSSPASVRADEGYAIVTRDAEVHDPISYTPDDTIHSFTTSFRVRSDCTGTVAAVLQDIPVALEISDSVLVDFGPRNDDDGRAAPSPDSRGLYWNSWRPVIGNDTVSSGIMLDNLIKTNGECSAVGLKITDSFKCNGRENGGLLAPDSSLLGYFAEPYATEDYFFSTGTSGFKITGLDPQFSYKLRFFGSRDTDTTRETRYTVNAGNGTFSTNLVTSGTGIGDGGYNGNNNIISELHDLVPDADGEISVNVSVISGGYAYIGIMEIAVEATKPLALNDRLLVDFGPSNDDDGRAAPSPDRNGNYWNSWRPQPGGSANPITVGTSLANLITTSDERPTSVSLEVTSGFLTSNGRVNGGLFYPDPALLGDFAVTNATEDYFADNNTGGFKITGLDRRFRYTLRFFGTRSSTATYATKYEVNAGNGTFSTNLVTSGTGIGDGGYNGNNNIIPELHDLIPDEDGEMIVNVVNIVGTYAYIGIMEITVAGEIIKPLALNDRLLVDFGPSNDDDGRAAPSPDRNGNYWNSWRPQPGSSAIPVGTSLANLKTTLDERPTSVNLEVTSEFLTCNGRVNGGLLYPDPALLGEFAVTNATEDYFADNNTAGFKITGLDQRFRYTLRFFGTRASTTTYATKYEVNAGNGTFSTNLVTSGTGIGDGGYNGNNNIIPELHDLIPDENGEMIVNVVSAVGLYAYIGIMEIVISGEIEKPLELNDRLLVDFGPSNDDDGRAAPSPDRNGNYWNSWRPLPGSSAISVGTSLANLIATSDGRPTSVSLEVISAFSGSNGIKNGGLLDPDPALLGDFAVTNATEDYFYSTGSGGFKVTGLNPDGIYALCVSSARVRQTSETRETRYTVTAGNGTYSIQTWLRSGSGVGTGGDFDGNNDTIAELSRICVPDSRR